MNRFQHDSPPDEVVYDPYRLVDHSLGMCMEAVFWKDKSNRSIRVKYLRSWKRMVPTP